MIVINQPSMLCLARFPSLQKSRFCGLPRKVQQYRSFSCLKKKGSSSGAHIIRSLNTESGKKTWKWGSVFLSVAAGVLGVSTATWIKFYAHFAPVESSQVVHCSSDGAVPTVSKLGNNSVYIQGIKPTLKEVVDKARDAIHSIKDEVGAPAIVVGVSIDGEEVWKEGFGFSNVENKVPCTPETVMRIASISKSMTVAAAAKLWEESELDLDKPVQYYVPSFPEKVVDNEKVVITARHLVSHLGGIRHYKKQSIKTEENNEKDKKKQEKQIRNKEPQHDSEFYEMYLKDKFDSVVDALKLFQDEPLEHKPGTKYLYTTHGFTLLSAVIESAAKTPFTVIMKNLFSALGLKTTYLDENEPLICNRSSYYEKKKNKLVNAPYVDNSYKWAGGGFLSTVSDLLRFGNAMLYSFQYSPSENALNTTPINIEHYTKEKSSSNSVLPTTEKTNLDKTHHRYPGFLKPETVKMLWTPAIKIPTKVESKFRWQSRSAWYGMGWGIIPENKQCEFCDNQSLYISHTGGAVGASSVLLILPREKNSGHCPSPPCGIVVTIITNLTKVQLSSTAVKIAQLFNEL